MKIEHLSLGCSLGCSSPLASLAQKLHLIAGIICRELLNQVSKDTLNIQKLGAKPDDCYTQYRDHQ